MAVSRKHIIAYRPTQQSNLYCFTRKENVYSYPVAILTVLNYHLLPKINLVVRDLMEHGFIAKWDTDYLYGSIQAVLTERRNYAKNFANGLPNPPNRIIILKTRHISGAIAILCFGYTLAVLAFLLELLIGKKLKAMLFNRKSKDLQCKLLLICDQIISDDCIFNK